MNTTKANRHKRELLRELKKRIGVHKMRRARTETGRGWPAKAGSAKR